ncbi:hypothetical protein MBLNU13_g08099t1 [Cladosporium sp. NU13]
MRENREHQQRSSSGTVDLWEHACLLYHGYEWQSAADAFLQLEQHVSDLPEKCVFAINKGLIEARLGDLDSATVSFTKAIEYDEGNPIAHFLLGLANTVPRNYTRALTQFEHCLNALNANEHDYRKYMGSFNLNALMVQENIDHMRSKLIATAAGHGRTSHLRTRLHIVPAEVLFEPPSRSTGTAQRDSESSTEQKLDFKGHEYTDERLQEPMTRAAIPLHVAGHDVQSLHLVEDAEKNLAIAPTGDIVNEMRRHRRLAPRDPRVQDGSMQELAQFLRHAGPGGDSNVTVDRKYMQRLLQGNHYDRAPLLAHSQVSEPQDEFGSLLGLYTETSSLGWRSVPTTIDSTSPQSYRITPYHPRHTSWPYNPSDFTRQDSSPDTNFYSSPRFVTHIDDLAIASLKSYYATVLPTKGRILDFCSSWTSHYPPSIEHAATSEENPPLKITGMGMNKAELAANKPLNNGRLLIDLNSTPENVAPALRAANAIGDSEEELLDASTCVVSIDYLTSPVPVLQSILSATKPGGTIHLTISNRCFPTKAMSRWLRVDEGERLQMVGDYLHFAGWKGIEIVELSDGKVEQAEKAEDSSSSGGARSLQGLFGMMGMMGRMDPLWVVRARRED